MQEGGFWWGGLGMAVAALKWSLKINSICRDQPQSHKQPTKCINWIFAQSLCCRVTSAQPFVWLLFRNPGDGFYSNCHLTQISERVLRRHGVSARVFAGCVWAQLGFVPQGRSPFPVSQRCICSTSCVSLTFSRMSKHIQLPFTIESDHWTSLAQVQDLNLLQRTKFKGSSFEGKRRQSCPAATPLAMPAVWLGMVPLVTLEHVDNRAACVPSYHETTENTNGSNWEMLSKPCWQKS